MICPKGHQLYKLRYMTGIGGKNIHRLTPYYYCHECDKAFRITMTEAVADNTLRDELVK